MMVLLMNRDLIKNAADTRVWNIIQADKGGAIFNAIDRVNLLFNNVLTMEIQASSKPALLRIGSFSEAHKSIVETLKLNDNVKALLAKTKTN